MTEKWDSDLVPQRTSYKKHAELAEAILRGELDEAYLREVIDNEDGTRPSPVICGGEVIEIEPYRRAEYNEDDDLPF